MKTFTALLSIVLTAAFSVPTAAQDVAGTWRVETVSNVEPPEGAALTLSLAGENKATITYTLAGESQSWQYTYKVADGQLMLEPAKPYGEPQTVTYDIKLDDGKLLLLTPKPEPIEEEEGDSSDAEGEEGDETEGDADAEEASDDEEAEEEDTRVPVWVLVKA